MKFWEYPIICVECEMLLGWSIKSIKHEILCHECYEKK